MKKLLLIFVLLFSSLVGAEPSSEYLEVLIKKNYTAEEFTNFEKLAERGDSDAQLNLGMIYYKGGAVAIKDVDNGIFWLEKSARQNNPYANYIVGVHYYKKYGYKKAFKFFNKASDLELGEAQHLLGVIHATGRETPQDYEKAFKFFVKAAEKGIPESQISLSKIYQEGLGTPINLMKAYMWQTIGMFKTKNLVSDADRATLVNSFTPDDFTKANLMVSACLGQKYKNCDNL